MANYKKKEEFIKNMDYLVNELKKEWDGSKEISHYVCLTLNRAEYVIEEVKKRILSLSTMLEENDYMSFKDSMEYCRENNILFRFARKLYTEHEEALKQEKSEMVLGLDKEEFGVYKELLGGNIKDTGNRFISITKRIRIVE